MKEKDKITAVITDLDGCLWDGTIAERQNIDLNKKYSDCLKDLYAKGIQLFVVSKNYYQDVINTFFKVGVSSNLFTKIVANWEPKYLNIERLLRQTNIRAETVIFIDDNPFELKEVNTALPNIKCIQFQNWREVLQSDYFVSLEEQSDTEIQHRINRYRSAISYSSFKASFKENPSFLKLLNRKMAIGEIFISDDIDRFAKLLALTHRINFNPEKFRDLEHAKTSLKSAIEQGHKLYGVSIWENDLPLGLSGGFVVKINGETAYIEDATFSCGIMGRDFEQRSLIELINELKNLGVEKVYFLITATSTNLRVIEILNELEFKRPDSPKEKNVFFLNLNSYRPIKKYDWIEVIQRPNFSEHSGIFSIVDFFERKVIPLMRRQSAVTNLGAARSEVLGHLQSDRKKIFYDFLSDNEITYTKVDLEIIPEENNILGNAEDLTDLIPDSSQDLVMAIELLEHTEHFWKVINEMIRICKVNGYIFISVPAFNYPKHEYPIDLWRIGPKTLLSFFPKRKFKIIKLEREGDQKCPRRLLLLVKKQQPVTGKYFLPNGGKINWKTGLTFFK